MSVGFCLQESRYQIDAVTRWFNGLINKDIDITNEIYSLQDVDFDRQVSFLSSGNYYLRSRV